MEKQPLNFEKYANVFLKVVKIEDTKFSGEHPNEINEGYTRTGFINLEISNKHQCLFILDGPDRYFHTSQVQKIEECEGYDLLTTLNSVYKVLPQFTSIPGTQEKYSVTLESSE